MEWKKTKTFSMVALKRHSFKIINLILLCFSRNNKNYFKPLYERSLVLANQKVGQKH